MSLLVLLCWSLGRIPLPLFLIKKLTFLDDLLTGIYLYLTVVCS